MSDEFENQIMEEIKAKGGLITKELMNQIVWQAIVCGEVTIKFNDDKTFEIVSPFKGCNCEGGE